MAIMRAIDALLVIDDVGRTAMPLSCLQTTRIGLECCARLQLKYRLRMLRTLSIKGQRFVTVRVVPRPVLSSV